MIKYRVPLFLLSLMSSHVFAAFDGFYLGASGGLANLQVNVQAERKVFSPSHTENNQLASRSGWGEIYGGWGDRICQCFYLGGRLGWNYASYDVKEPLTFHTQGTISSAIFVSNLSSQARTKLNTSEFFADAKPGWILGCGTMVFGLVGVAVNREALQEKDSGGAGFTIFTPISFSSHQQSHKAALRLGLGLDQCLFCHVHLVASYVYTRYQKLSVSGRSGNQTTQVTAKPRKSVGALGLAYYF